MKIQTPANLVKSLPPEIIDLLGPPPVLSTEDTQIYYAVFACFVNDINPRDIIAWMMIKDLADYRWEIVRYRRVKAALIQKALDDFVSKGQRDATSTYETCCTTLAAKYGAENKAVEKELADKPEELKKRKLQMYDQHQTKMAAAENWHKQKLADWEAVRASKDASALVLNSWIHEVQKIDKLVEIAEKRFYDALHAIERHVGGFGETLRGRGEKIIEGEVVDRSDGTVEGGNSNVAQIRKKAG